ncbi:N-lysine methyltransferase KMT5A-like [Lineus longissimus]|uniref:N-lysine methyltransferase KMT5A-like n=1 Tax=Lineus longissimus TaxID=88925 RepID=UPI00315CF058
MARRRRAGQMEPLSSLCTKLEVKEVNEYVGKGLFAAKPFAPGDFVVEYEGDLITASEATRREITKKYTQNRHKFLYDFVHNGEQLCIDSTNNTETFGRYANDAPQRLANTLCEEGVS